MEIRELYLRHLLAELLRLPRPFGRIIGGGLDIGPISVRVVPVFDHTIPRLVSCTSLLDYPARSSSSRFYPRD